MRVRSVIASVAGVALSAALVAGCGSAADHDATPTPRTSIGPGEGSLRLLAPPGYAENGGDDPRVDWVTPFTKRTGCTVTVRTAADASDLATLARSRSYDGVLAPPATAGSLIAGGAVVPINTSLVKGYADITGPLRHLPGLIRGGRHYGVPDVWRPDLLIYNTRRVKPAPTGWGAVFAPRGRAGRGRHITVPGSALTIADAAMYLRRHRTGLHITDPYELTGKQFRAALGVLTTLRPHVARYWKRPVDAIEAYAGEALLGIAGPYQVDVLSRAGRPIAGRVPAGGTTASVDAWLVSARVTHPNCMYQWLAWSITPQVQAQVSEWLGDDPANPDACGRLDRFCSAYHAADSSFIAHAHFAHLPTRDCGDRRGDTCVPYQTWRSRWRELTGIG